MPKRIAFQPKRVRRRTFFKEWRTFRGLSQEQLAGRLETSVASISRIENGTQPYTQDVLEALADALMTDPASLLMRNPEDPEAIWSLWERAKPGERQMIVDIAKTVTKTGTDN
ncbi:transcriptional regulator with XRE-family HTH domain [Bradyrhizobium elkanii]|uniref:helix-turn-helix domain-containing protein n=1 Tax=Bradyrhizobium elkanii TaxID=29448 RepID=UPI00216A05C1|nr:helix-turn-helix transcriptional regulator [Bradyrhizobium elkanii]MCS3692033.1 transcriptional regulator with XRE-family HTH domain [Bradyrhizobium elkanii]